MNLWITGAGGFIGHHLACHLSRHKHSVAGIGHGASPEISGHASILNEWLSGDICLSNLDALGRGQGKPDAIFHLAGGSSVAPSLDSPLKDMQRSVDSIGNVLEWVRLKSPSTVVVMASSAAIYGSDHSCPIKESMSSTPYSPYGYHKRMAELLMESYGSSFGLKVAIVRLFSVYGIELRKQLLWDACRRLADGENVVEFAGSGEELRDWLHVADAVSILCNAMENATDDCLVLNGGTGTATSVREITNMLCEKWGGGSRPVFTGISREGDPKYLVADTGRLKSLGFSPKYCWQQGLGEYVKWFKAQL